MYGVNVQIPPCPDVIFILHRDIHSISQLHFRALAKVYVTPLRYLELYHWFAPRISSIATLSQRRDNCVLAHFATQRTSASKRKPSCVCPHARASERARDKKDVILAYLNVLISQARISGCTKAEGVPSVAAGGGGGSHPARSMGEFSLWLQERAATMVIYLMRRLGRGGGGQRRRGNGRVKERARIVFARARVRESVSKNNGLQHPLPLHLDENVTQ